MTDCELLCTCPYFGNELYRAQELTQELKEEYCHGDYALCGRYMAYKARERDRETENSKIAAHIHWYFHEAGGGAE